jgi:hypothetical protein
MSLTVLVPSDKSRLRALLDHFSIIEDWREPWRVAHPLPEVLLLVVLRRKRATWQPDYLAAILGHLPC